MGRSMWLVAVIALVALFAVSGINTIPKLDESVSAKWASVENEYQRRTDLIPNLVESVKGYANFEQNTLTDVIEARASATKVTLSPQMLSDPNAVKQFEEVQKNLSSALSRLLVSVEKYPDLKADQNFIALQSQLEGTENRITIARKDYIEAVQVYNTTVRTFPGLIWAKLYGAAPKQVFTASTGADKPPVVKF